MRGSGIGGNHLEIDPLAEPHEAVVRTHAWMLAAAVRHDSQGPVQKFHARCKVRSRDDDVIELRTGHLPANDSESLRPL